MRERLLSLLEQRLAALPSAARMSAEVVLSRDLPTRPGVDGACRLIRARDTWVALNMSREEDWDVIPALTGIDGRAWSDIEDHAQSSDAADFCARAAELQLPVAVLGEAAPYNWSEAAPLAVPTHVVDLSALWAGPLASGILAAVGASVIRVENTRRPDPTSQNSPELDVRINGRKDRKEMDLTSPDARAQLLALIAEADVLVTSGRAAALARLGLSMDALERINPGLIWLAITGHGFTGNGAQRVGFGDDCAVAGGLVQMIDGRPQFLGDALADPLTGVEGALAVMRRAAASVPGVIDLPLAGVAARNAHALACEC